MAIFKHLGRRLATAYKRDPQRSLQEWAEKEVIFTDLETSPILGNFKIKYSPQYKKLFKLIDRTLTRELFAKWASQSGKSLFGVLVAAHKLDTLPATVIYAQPLKDDVSTILQTKINPVLKSIPKLWKKFEDYRDSEKIRTKDAAKKLAGGNFLVKGSGVKDRKSQTSPFIVLDEIGEFEKGSVFEFKERTKSYTKFHPKVIGLSTIVHPDDEICTNFDMCAVILEWHFICPECHENFYPSIDYFKYPSAEAYAKEVGVLESDIKMINYIDKAKAEVHIECPNKECMCKIDTKVKDKMIFEDMMDWFIINRDGSTERLIVEDLKTETSFGADMNSFGSYFVTFEDMVENLIKAEDDPIKLDKMYRGWFNRFYERNKVDVEQDDMLLLGNNIAEWTIPKDTIRTYMTIDNQKDYLYVQITAITYGICPHLVYFGELVGSDCWLQAESLWESCQYLTDEDGKTISAATMGVDRRGYNEGDVSRTDEADAFVNYMTQKWGEDRIYGMEGHPSAINGQAYVVKNHKDYSNQRKELKVKVIKFSNLNYKDQLFRSINRSILKAKAESEEDAGYDYEDKLLFINQDNIERDKKQTVNSSLTKMLTAEVLGFYKNPKTGKIADTETYIPIRKRNDAIDTTCMALVLADKDKLILKKKPTGEDLSKILQGIGSIS
jgi:phage terminase large subunit GpA-like protein